MAYLGFRRVGFGLEMGSEGGMGTINDDPKGIPRSHSLWHTWQSEKVYEAGRMKKGNLIQIEFHPHTKQRT